MLKSPNPPSEARQVQRIWYKPFALIFNVDDAHAFSFSVRYVNGQTITDNLTKHHQKGNVPLEIRGQM